MSVFGPKIRSKIWQFFDLKSNLILGQKLWDFEFDFKWKNWQILNSMLNQKIARDRGPVARDRGPVIANPSDSHEIFEIHSKPMKTYENHWKT